MIVRLLRFWFIQLSSFDSCWFYKADLQYRGKKVLSSSSPSIGLCTLSLQTRTLWYSMLLTLLNRSSIPLSRDTWQQSVIRDLQIGLRVRDWVRVRLFNSSFQASHYHHTYPFHPISYSLYLKPTWRTRALETSLVWNSEIVLVLNLVLVVQSEGPYFHIRHGYQLNLRKFLRMHLVCRGIKRSQGSSIRTRLPITVSHLKFFYSLLAIRYTSNYDSLMIWAAITLREHPSENHAVLKHGSTSTLSDFAQILCRATL